MKVKVSIAANAKGVTLGKYIDYQNAVDKVEQVHIITGKTSESIRQLQSHVIDEIIMRFEAAIKLGSNDFERKVRIGAIELGFVPNLNELTFGEYIDWLIHYNWKCFRNTRNIRFFKFNRQSKSDRFNNP